MIQAIGNMRIPPVSPPPPPKGGDPMDNVNQDMYQLLFSLWFLGIHDAKDINNISIQSIALAISQLLKDISWLPGFPDHLDAGTQAIYNGLTKNTHLAEAAQRIASGKATADDYAYFRDSPDLISLGNALTGGSKASSTGPFAMPTDKGGNVQDWFAFERANGNPVDYKKTTDAQLAQLIKLMQSFLNDLKAGSSGDINKLISDLQALDKLLDAINPPDSYILAMKALLEMPIPGTYGKTLMDLCKDPKALQDFLFSQGGAKTFIDALNIFLKYEK